VRYAADYGALLEAVRGMAWPARRAVRSGAPGTHRSRLRGVSPEFSEYRAFRQGDDPRRLDWKLLARTDRPYLRLATDRATVPTAVLVDATASMAFPDGADAKWRQARRLAMGLAAVALAAGDPVGMVVAGSVDQPVRRTRPRTRGGTLGELARALETTEPSGGPGDLLATEIERVPWAARIVVVSDFLDEDGGAADVRTAGLVGALRGRAAAQVEAHAVHLMARAELAPPRTGFLAVDPDAPAVRRPFVTEAAAEYDRRFTAWRETLAAALRRAGVVYHAVLSDEPAARAIRRMTAGGR
jgi:uncharacterized protein (DUF58 family)